jgi:hypothetical protein
MMINRVALRTDGRLLELMLRLIGIENVILLGRGRRCGVRNVRPPLTASWASSRLLILSQHNSNIARGRFDLAQRRRGFQARAEEARL